MTKLLHIDSSILGGNSVSRQLTAQIVASWRAANPGTEVSYLDLAVNTPSHLSTESLGFRMPADATLSDVQKRENAVSEALMSQFLAADLRNAVDPGLELAGDGEVVEGRTHHDHVRSEELRDQGFRHGVFALLRIGQDCVGGHAKAQRFGRQVAGGIDGQVQVADFGARVGGAPGSDDLGGELAGNRVAAKNAGVDVKKLGHDENP